MKRKLIILAMFFAFLCVPFSARSQIVGVHTNGLGWVTAMPNIGLEVGFAKNWSFELDGGINPFSWSEGRKTKLWAVQPELKWWPAHNFTGHYIGLHGQYGQYDWGLWKYRYKGFLGGCGLSYGYAWMVHKRWNIEATVGFGWNLLGVDHKYDRRDPLVYYGPAAHGQWGLTKVGIKVTYIIK